MEVGDAAGWETCVTNRHAATKVGSAIARFDLPALLKKFPKIQTASTGPETSKALAALNLQPTLEGKDHSMDGLLGALLKAVRR